MSKSKTVVQPGQKTDPPLHSEPKIMAEVVSTEEEPPEPNSGGAYAKEANHILPDGSYIFPAAGLRHCIQDADGCLRSFLLGYNIHFLPVIGFVLWSCFLVLKACGL